MKFIHISDLHFHRNNKDNKKVNDMLKQIKTKYPNHKLIVTGDITDDGHEKQYLNAQKALKPFKDNVFICPGNHDFGAVGNFFSRERAERFDQYLSVHLEQGGTFTGDNTPVVNMVRENGIEVMLIALDSNLETMLPFDFACGKIGKSQLKALDAIINDPGVAHIRKILFFHHHPFVRTDPFMELKDAKKLVRRIYGKVNVLMFGHKHKTGYWNNYSGIEHVIASDNSPGKNNAVEEVEFTSTEIKVASKTI